MTARNFQSVPKIANFEDYDVRYVRYPVVPTWVDFRPSFFGCMNVLIDVFFIQCMDQEGPSSLTHTYAPHHAIRYTSMSTIAMVEGGPTCDTLDDAAFIRFYGDRPGWNEHRAYTVVAGESPDKTCGLYNAEEDLFLTSTIDGAAMEYWGAF